ncbi:MAG: tRNA pseudouridine(55) synthase TruB [Thermodesulfobacteriota bacterium]
MNGVLIADKPSGWTSHDVVAAVKKKLGARKVGHLGTLDPLATGVLPLVINRATRFARFLDGGAKVYLASMELGRETDTYDRDGAVVATHDVEVTEDDIRAAFSPFKGRIKQLPPMYSSKKLNGVPLYKLARKGMVVEREPKEVEIFACEITAVTLPLVEFRVECSKGTYIRSICHDVGTALGCGAHLVSLRRLGCGEFLASEAITPEAAADTLSERIIPIEEALRRAGVEECPLKV